LNIDFVKQEKIQGLGGGKRFKSFPIGPEEIEAVKKNCIILWLKNRKDYQ